VPEVARIIRSFRRDLRVLEREVARTLSRETVCCGVTIAQCHVLLEIEERGRTSVSELVSALELDKSTLSRTVDGLCCSGLLSRETDSGNRRRQIIALTDKGSAASDSINDTCDTYYGRLLASIPERQRRMIVESAALLGRAMRDLRNGSKRGRARWSRPKRAVAGPGSGKGRASRRRGRRAGSLT
jgi:DNA-binding MarR family transcriptional regulator